MPYDYQYDFAPHPPYYTPNYVDYPSMNGASTEEHGMPTPFVSSSVSFSRSLMLTWNAYFKKNLMNRATRWERPIRPRDPCISMPRGILARKRISPIKENIHSIHYAWIRHGSPVLQRTPHHPQARITPDRSARTSRMHSVWLHRRIQQEPPPFNLL